MSELLGIAVSVLGFGLGLVLVMWMQRPAPLGPNRRQPLDTGVAEPPCWTEEIASDGRLRYARSECVRGLLMELDKRADRGDFPIPVYY